MQTNKQEVSHTSTGRKPINWKKIKSEYYKGSSMTSLSETYHVSKSTISVRAKKEKWQEGREKRNKKIEQNVEKEIIAKKTEYEQAFLSALFELTTKTMEGIKCCAKKDSKSLRNYASILKDLRDIGVYRSNLDVEEQKARIEKLQKDSTKEVTDDKTIEVSFYDVIDEFQQ
ncbi:MAG: hypothetical protein J6U37_01565 [Lachnospiraceae bacterium]|nr:hypothetical protein [Lachnospiraceae bacterium]